jgi:disulfide bond formation protein DsbB
MPIHRFLDREENMKTKQALWGIFAQSLVAMTWSLYYWRYWDPIANMDYWYFFSPLNALAPCELCRYARILMYPIVFLSAIALYTNDKKVVKYTLPLSGIGLLLEIYHYTLQKTDFVTSFTCTAANPCDALGVNYLWFITIPFLCGVAFAVIFALSMYIYRKNKK